MIPRAERSRYRAHVRRSAAPPKLPSVLRGLIGGADLLSKTGALLLILACIGFWPLRAAAYSVLSHEAIIDSAWDTNIKPLLLKRFPDATADELREAHGYAYGGAIIQDMGYYPHGSMFFSDLAHYVRSGDFVVALLRDSRDLNEYAFAIGALAHVKTEFGFDVLEVAKERYAPDSYHDFIGFQVAAPLLEQAFRETYGLDLKKVLSNEEKVIGSYRRDVSRLIPRATRIAWSLKEKDIKKDVPGITRKKFLFNLSRSSYERTWGKEYQRPTFWDRFLAFLYRLLPKFGPLRVLQLKTPTPETERMFQASFNATMDRYRNLLKEQGEGRLKLANNNFDVGEFTPPGKYRMNDDAHAKLLDKLAEQNFADMTPDLRADLLDFFSDPNAPYATKRNPKLWTKVEAELQQLKAKTPQPVSAEALPAAF